MASFRLATIVLLAAGVFAAYNSAFTVNQTQQALVLQLGEPKRTIQEPGLALSCRSFRTSLITKSAFSA